MGTGMGKGLVVVGGWLVAGGWLAGWLVPVAE
jgi:hypothetical protein